MSKVGFLSDTLKDSTDVRLRFWYKNNQFSMRQDLDACETEAERVATQLVYDRLVRMSDNLELARAALVEIETLLVGGETQRIAQKALNRIGRHAGHRAES